MSPHRVGALSRRGLTSIERVGGTFGAPSTVSRDTDDACVLVAAELKKRPRVTDGAAFKHQSQLLSPTPASRRPVCGA